MPNAKRKNPEISTGLISFDDLLTETSKKMKTTLVSSHEYDSHSMDDSLTLMEDEKQIVDELTSMIPDSPDPLPFEESFSFLPNNTSGEDYRFDTVTDHEHLTKHEQQLIDELATVLPDSAIYQQTDKPSSPNELVPSVDVDRSKTNTLVEGNSKKNAYQLLRRTFGDISSKERTKKFSRQEINKQIAYAITLPHIQPKHIAVFFDVSLNNVYEISQKQAYQLLYKEFGEVSKEREDRNISQKIREQIAHALTLPDLSQSQIATFFGVSQTTVNKIYHKQSVDVEDNTEKYAHQLLYERFGEVPKEKEWRIIPQELRNQIVQALTIPTIRQKDIASFFNITQNMVSKIKQEVIRRKQLTDITKNTHRPMPSRSFPTSSNHTNER
ncbi:MULTISPECIES: hypothetical protein [unclassified Enterococcus]|uniref:hypothetical protein n=1 Tax=unclassified Enterococcus TaxID=2608891 RepID=UPI0013E9FD8A|nr:MULTISPECIES: hypothetical protein [unclassified Enterococcus]